MINFVVAFSVNGASDIKFKTNNFTSHSQVRFETTFK